MPVSPAAVPRTALYAAIDDHLRGVPAVGRSVPRTRSNAAFGVALSLALLPLSAAEAATLNVDSADASFVVDGACTLPEAVQNANDNAATNVDCVAGTDGLDTIVFDPTLSSSEITLDGTLLVSDELAIVGGAIDIAINGYGQRILETDAALTVSGLTLFNGRADDFSPDGRSGGAIHARAPLVVDDVAFYGNDAKYQGGAVFSSESLSVTDSQFIGNRVGIENSNAHGGAIFSAGDTVIEGTFFYDNSANGAGGALFVTTHADISDSVFEYNDAYSGGGVFAGTHASGSVEAKGLLDQPLTVSISGSTFDYNAATGAEYLGAGGGVAFMPMQSDAGGLAHALDIEDSVFQDNLAIPFGAQGAAAAKGKYVTGGGGLAVVITDSDMPLRAKGAPAADQIAVGIDDSTFTGNFALLGGGAMLFASSVTIAGSSFAGNAAYIGGGAILGNKYDGDPGAAPTTVALSDTSVTGNGAVFGAGLFASGTTVTGSGLTVTGNISGAPYSQQTAAAAKGFGLPVFECGGGKYLGGIGLHATETLTVSGTNTISDNCADGAGGAMFGIGPGGSGSISAGTVISDNSVDGNAGGAALWADDGGALLFEGTVTGNSAYRGAGLQLSPYGTGLLTISGATISGNTATGNGGGLALESTAGRILVANSTVSDNSARAGGGAAVESMAPPAAASKGSVPTIVFENVTVHGNQATGVAVAAAKGTDAIPAGSGGGIAVADASVLMSFATVTGNSAAADGGGLWIGALASAGASNSVVAENTADGIGNDVAGALTANFTLLGDASGATIGGSDNDIGSAPLLGPLQDNGGPTSTRAALAGSPVLDSGDPAIASPPPTDQRGSGFPRVQGAAVDKGAVEGDPLVTALSIAPDQFAEGSDSILTVSLAGIATADVLVTVDFSGDAVIGSDFTAADDDALTPGVQVLIAAGASSGDILLSAVADGIDEVEEAFAADVGAISGPASEAGSVQDSASILDADPAPAVLIDDVVATESEGSATFSVTLSAPSSLPISVDFDSSDGTAIAGEDYTAVSGTLAFAPGETLQQVVVALTADGINEPGETFFVDLSEPVNANIGDIQGTGAITDSDPPPTVSLSLVDSVLVEETGSTQLVATLSAVSSEDVTVTLAWSGSATLGTDYSAGLQIVIPAGSLSGALTITTIDDTAVEGNETIVVDIASVTNGTESGVQQASATIDDSVDAAGAGPGTGPTPLPAPAIIPTLSEWMLMLLGLLLPVTVLGRLRRRVQPVARRD